MTHNNQCRGISIIVPMLNEADQLPELLQLLLAWKRKGCQVLLVDGGSTDHSAALAEAIGFPVISAPRGRACQMNAGAQAASKDILLFFHADTRLPDNADRLVCNALVNGRYDWGRFDVRITGEPFMLKVVAWFMNHRSRLTGIATGDQAIFVTRKVFERIGGFPEQPLMEDIELSRRLRKLSPPCCVTHKVTTSGRRWETNGLWRTIWLMWQLRFAYWQGTPAEKLAGRYR